MALFEHMGRPPKRVPGLRELRERVTKMSRKRATLDSVAEAIGIASITLWRIEKGHRRASDELLRRLARHYKVTLQEVEEAYAITRRETGADKEPTQ